jgi:serine/threonine-protein kinase
MLPMQIGMPSGTPTTTSATARSRCSPLDTAGNVYVTDSRNNRVLKLAAGATSATELPFGGLNHPAGVAVDADGNIYVAGKYNNRALKLAAGWRGAR